MELTAFVWGLASALSLPLGAALGIVWRPGSRINSAFMAFGAGALLFALTIELMSHVPHYVDEHGRVAMAVAAAGALAGGLIFDVVNQLLNNRGAFLRSLSATKDHVARTKRARARRWLRRLAKMKLLRELPPEHVAELVKRVRKERYRPGQVIYVSGDAGEEVHFIRRGRIEIVDEGASEAEGRQVAVLDRHDTFGEMHALTDRPWGVAARALDDVELYTLDRDDLEPLMARSPELRTAIERMARTRADGGGDEEETNAWSEAAEDYLDDLNVSVTEEEMQEERSGVAVATGGAALAIWLGIGIDALPESVVIGTLAIGPEGMSLAFIAGVFLANLPEAMASAVSMRGNGMAITRIMLMWTSLFVLTGIGAAVGAWLFPPEPVGTMFFVKLAIEALAAGAMLTMIAETMLPEAFEQGGSIIGFATLCGFLTALAVAAL